MLFKLLNGAASPANCARKIPGPLIVLIVFSTPPRIYDEVLRRAFFRRVRSQEQRHVRDVTRKHSLLQTLPGHHFFLEFRRIPQFDLPLRPHRPRRNRVHSYPERPQLASQNPRQPRHRSLAHVVYRETSMLEPPNNRTQVDNRASAKPLHLRRHRLGRKKHVPQVHRDPLIPVLRRNLFHLVPVVVPRIVDEHSNITHLPSHDLDSLLQRANIVQVARDKERRLPRLLLNLSRQRPARPFRNIHERHARSLPGKRPRKRRPNPAPSSCNKHRFASQPRVSYSFASIHTSQPPRPRRDATLLIFHFKGNLCAEAQRRRAEDARRTQRATRAQSERSGSSRGAGPCLVLLQYWSEYVVPNLDSTPLRYSPD